MKAVVALYLIFLFGISLENYKKKKLFTWSHKMILTILWTIPISVTKVSVLVVNNPTPLNLHTPSLPLPPPTTSLHLQIVKGLNKAF